MRRAVVVLATLLVARFCFAQSYERFADQIYLHEGGAAFTCDFFKAKKPNGAAIIFMVSGGWVSDHKAISLDLAEAMTSRGYTCIQVVHGSQPRYKLPEIVKQVTRAVRFVHSQAEKYAFDPNRIGISGGSAGGHLSLYIAARADAGDPDAKDPIDRLPATVRAVGVFFPPTDFNHWGPDGKPAFSNPLLQAAFGKAFVDDPVKLTPEKAVEIGTALSPATYVTASMPPTLLIHGDADTLVPIYQSYSLKKKLDELKVPNKLIVKPGKGHGYKGMEIDFLSILDWFDKYLK